MIKKEFKDIIGPTLARLSILILLPIIKLINDCIIGPVFDFRKVFLTCFGLVIYWISFDYYIKFFKYENNDHAWEYLLSLPMNRRRILFIKLFPRFVCLGVLFSIYVITAHLTGGLSTKESDIIYPLLLLSAILIVLINSPVFGIIKFKNSPLLLLMDYSLIGLATWIISSPTGFPFTTESSEYSFIKSMIFVTVIISVILFIFFMKYFKSYDLKPASIHGRQFTRYAMPYMASLLLIFIIIIILKRVF